MEFEWAWQHPTESVAVRQAAATFKSFSGVANKIKLAYTMLNLPAWRSLNITVNYFSTKYTKHSAACPSLPEHMKVQVCPIDELPCYTETDETLLEFTDAEYVFDDKEEYDNAANINGTVEANMTEIQSHSMDGFPCYHKGEESSGSKDSNVEQCNEEYGKREQTVKNIFADYPPTAEVDHALVGSASSPFTDFSDDGLTSMNKNISDLDWLNGKRFREESDKDPHPIHNYTSPQEIEVIDLLSPSSGFKIRSSIKKRRISTVCPEIIDLT
ncbi:hypothetical protein GH714_011668 [Hevea brasiliensis]|uniref:Structure-specific endonuclease subunit SLX1 homolog n=1 Tax=Hevea brasiliensis TaxID=3981 RepID=A0A6A6L9D9_HEVBR|nr:hypothetical protein GH714_011668 [Hevea brasiliensis]